MKTSASTQAALFKLVLIETAFCVVLACVLLVALYGQWSKDTSALASSQPAVVAEVAASPLAPRAPPPPRETSQPSPTAMATMPPLPPGLPEPAEQPIPAATDEAPEPTPDQAPAETPARVPAPGVAAIELQVRLSGPDCCGRLQGLWTVVQWQDGQGAWHDVMGWGGELDESGRRRWGVEAKDYGAGPFRWLVLSPCRCQVLVASEPFFLPEQDGETVYVPAPPEL